MKPEPNNNLNHYQRENHQLFNYIHFSPLLSKQYFSISHGFSCYVFKCSPCHRAESCFTVLSITRRERSHYGPMSFITSYRGQAGSLLCVLVSPRLSTMQRLHSCPQAQLEDLMDSTLIAM